MSEPWCVLVAVDFSPSSRCAFDLATALCQRADTPMRLLHVWNPSQVTGTGALLPAVSTWIADYKQRLADTLDDWGERARTAGVPVTCQVTDGVASRTIPEVARTSRAGLVVMGRRGSANLAHVLLGSVSERVAHLSPCPVLVVPGSEEAPRPPERLLVGVDFSDAARDAYRAALFLARELAAEGGLALVHARPGAAERALEAGIERVGQVEYPFDRAALERWGRLPESAGLPISTGIVEGNASRALVREAEARSCDWIVVGLQGQGALGALLTGSTTDRVLKLSDRPVLVVPLSAPSPGESTG